MGDLYVQQSQRCQEMALDAKTEEQRATWLELADAWLRLAAWRDRRASNGFDLSMPEMSTGQEESKASP